MRRPTPIEIEHYKALEGRTITSTSFANINGEPAPVLFLSGKDKEGKQAMAVVMSDAEGNGAG